MRSRKQTASRQSQASFQLNGTKESISPSAFCVLVRWAHLGAPALSSNVVTRSMVAMCGQIFCSRSNSAIVASQVVCKTLSSASVRPRGPKRKSRTSLMMTPVCPSSFLAISCTRRSAYPSRPLSRCDCKLSRSTPTKASPSSHKRAATAPPKTPETFAPNWASNSNWSWSTSRTSAMAGVSPRTACSGPAEGTSNPNSPESEDHWARALRACRRH